MTSSRFSFLRRVRIHGGECGAVARALHHAAQKVALVRDEQTLISDEKAFSRQADPKKAFGSTIERKQMSTKTTLKRVALVAVSALGFGLLSIVPTQAAGRTAASLTVGTIPSFRVGEAATVPVTINLPAGTEANDTITVFAKITSAPIMGGTANAASALGLAGANNGNDSGARFGIFANSAGSTDFATGTTEHGRTTTNAATTAGNTVINNGAGTDASVVTNYVITAANVTAGSITARIKIVPDVAGNYSVLVSTNNAGNAFHTAGDISTTFTISTGTSPTGVSLTVLGGGTTITGGSPNGVAIRVSLTGGALGGDEAISLTPSGVGRLSKGASATAAVPDTFAAAGTAVTLTKDDFINGRKTVWLSSSVVAAASTVSLTATGTGSLSSSVTTTSTFSVVVGAGSTSLELALEAPSSTATYAMTNATASGNDIIVTEASTSQRIGFTTPANMTAQRGYITVTDTLGTISGVAGLRYDVATSFAATAAASGGSFSFAASGVGVVAGSELFRVEIPASSADVMGLDASAATRIFKTAARTNSAFVISPATTILAAPGAAITLTAELDDQFGVPRANQTVTITTTGRNNPAAVTRVTDADGLVTFTTADASTSTTNLLDTITFSATGATPASVQISYANTAVSTLTVTGGNTNASVTSLTQTVNPISIGSTAATGTSGPEGATIDVTATVRDSLGNALAGVPVSFSVAGSGAAFTSTTATLYTGSAGTAVGKLYAWLNGTYTYTVTAGGKSTTGTATFASTTAGNARVVSAAVRGNVVTGKAVDRFGNPVSGVRLWAITTSPANIGGSFTTFGDTNATGEVSWVVSGNGSVRVTAVDPSLPAGSTFGQTCALAGNRNCATASVAAVAYGTTTAGTTSTNEKNVGASFAPAGVASATVTVSQVDAAESAADAALEAIDAANAATDAANLAAEAADAATVAAEEARDAADAATAAVEALASEVATLIAGLKAQITTLANTVAKIAKRVRA